MRVTLFHACWAWTFPVEPTRAMKTKSRQPSKRFVMSVASSRTHAQIASRGAGSSARAVPRVQSAVAGAEYALPWLSGTGRSQPLRIRYRGVRTARSVPCIRPTSNDGESFPECLPVIGQAVFRETARLLRRGEMACRPHGKRPRGPSGCNVGATFPCAASGPRVVGFGGSPFPGAQSAGADVLGRQGARCRPRSARKIRHPALRRPILRAAKIDRRGAGPIVCCAIRHTVRPRPAITPPSFPIGPPS